MRPSGGRPPEIAARHTAGATTWSSPSAVGSGKFGFPFWKLEPADWDRVLKVNLVGAVNVAHAFAPAMAEAADGCQAPAHRSMLFLSSVAGQIGSQTDPPYSAAKAAVINFAQCAAKDLRPVGVRVNALCPGMVQTPLNRGVYEAWARSSPRRDRPAYEEWAAEKIQKLVPLNRWQAARGHRRHGRLPRLEPRRGTSPARRSTSTAGM